MEDDTVVCSKDVRLNEERMKIEVTLIKIAVLIMNVNFSYKNDMRMPTVVQEGS